MVHKFSLIVSVSFLFLISSSILSAQNDYDFHRLGSETMDFFNKPVKWNGKDFLTLAAVMGGTFAVLQFDESVRDEMLKDREYVGSLPLEIGRCWGEPVTSILLSSVFLFHGIANDNTANKKLGFEIGQSFLYTGITTGILKILFSRSRPYTGRGSFSFDPINLTGDNYWSLPSGHTSLAFSLSTIISANLKNDLFKAAVFIPSFVTAFSRVYYNMHWASDVFLGALVGYFIGQFVSDQHEKNLDKTLETNAGQPMFNITIPF